MFKLYDANGNLWIWNKRQERVYLQAAEEEFIKLGIPVIENGYPASTLERAWKLLDEDGLFDKDE